MSSEAVVSVEFERKDYLTPEEDYLKEFAESITDDIYYNPKLLEVLRDFLFLFPDYGVSDNLDGLWKREIEGLKATFGKNELDDFSDKLFEMYGSMKTSRHYKKIRGLLFEGIMELHYKDLSIKRSCKFESGCMISINGNEIIYISPEREKRKTVDIALWSELESLFYELKVGPGYFNETVIGYLNLLCDKAYENNISRKTTVGCMTLKTRFELMRKLNKDKLSHKNLEIYGYKEVLDKLSGNSN